MVFAITVLFLFCTAEFLCGNSAREDLIALLPLTWTYNFKDDKSKDLNLFWNKNKLSFDDQQAAPAKNFSIETFSLCYNEEEGFKINVFGKDVHNDAFIAKCKDEAEKIKLKTEKQKEETKRLKKRYKEEKALWAIEKEREKNKMLQQRYEEEKRALAYEIGKAKQASKR